jgi:hypothetical protein
MSFARSPEGRRGPDHKEGKMSLRKVAAAATLVYLLTIATAHAQNFGGWSAPKNVDVNGVAGINTAANQGCPNESPDGLTLFYASNHSGDLDVWIAHRESTDQEWSSPEPLAAPVNQAGTNEFCPTPLPGHGLLFVSNRGHQCGTSNNPDIYFTRYDPARAVWTQPEALGCEINSASEELSPSYVEAEGLSLLFFSSNRADGGRQKIFMSLLLQDGTWMPAVPVVELNRAGAQDARPNVRKDGLEIVFDSTRGTGTPDIYTATRNSIFDAWSDPVPVDSVNDPVFAESRATISRDGRRLYFGSTRNAGRGSDLFVSTRSGPGNSSKN